MEITIRHSEPQDFAAIKAIYAQPSCYSATLQHPYPSDAMWQERMANADKDSYSLVAEVDGQIVGQLGLAVCPRPRRKHVANVGMGVLEQYQGKGVGSALLGAALDLAINWLAVTRIELEVYVDNDAARKLYEKHGFELEGTAKNYAFRHGQYVDAYLMAKVV